MNRASAIVGSSGVTSNYLSTLEVTGRKSARTFSLPVVVAIVHGQRYLVSMLGDDVQWVRNASGQRAEGQSFGAAIGRTSDLKRFRSISGRPS